MWLASASPRRRLLLDRAGLAFEARPSDLDDAALRRGRVSVAAWVMALAYFKARRVADLLAATVEDHCGVVLGADTLCAHEDEILGQPRDEADARRMLHMMRNAVHRTLTGVCLIELPSRRRMLARDEAIVTVGDVTDVQIETYIDSGQWRGKAGAYNLSERLEAGWPIECRGDPATVMGLPMRRLPGWLERFRNAS